MNGDCCADVDGVLIELGTVDALIALLQRDQRATALLPFRLDDGAVAIIDVGVDGIICSTDVTGDDASQALVAFCTALQCADGFCTQNDPPTDGRAGFFRRHAAAPIRFAAGALIA